MKPEKFHIYLWRYSGDRCWNNGLRDSARYCCKRERACEPVAVSEAADASQSADENPAIEEEEPDNDWQFDTPENHGMDAALLAQLHDAAEGAEIYSIVTAKDGYIVDEYYKDGYDEDSVFRFNSCTKSVTGALAGIAIDAGYISGVDAWLFDFFPRLSDSDDTLKQEVTVEHLLEHTSGDEVYDVYYAMGYAGQYIFVVPRLALVTVVTSRFQDAYAPQYYI